MLRLPVIRRTCGLLQHLAEASFLSISIAPMLHKYIAPCRATSLH